MTVLGVDPGLDGALACYDYNTGTVQVEDMPTFSMVISKKTRRRVDANALLDYFEMQKAMGAELVIIEAVGGRPKQSASSAFVFGYTVGLIYMAAITNRIPVETVPPQVWKKILNVPGKVVARTEKDKMAILTGEKPKVKQKESDGAIIMRADELMPDYTKLWRGPNGGYKVDRAEAAMLALYGGRYALNSTKVINIKDPELALIYRNADTGA